MPIQDLTVSEHAVYVFSSSVVENVTEGSENLCTLKHQKKQTSTVIKYKKSDNVPY